MRICVVPHASLPRSFSHASSRDDFDEEGDASPSEDSGDGGLQSSTPFRRLRRDSTAVVVLLSKNGSYNK